jgi:hypothetical protein
MANCAAATHFSRASQISFDEDFEMSANIELRPAHEAI